MGLKRIFVVNSSPPSGPCIVLTFLSKWSPNPHKFDAVVDLWTSLTTTTVQEHTHHDGHQKCTQDSKHRPEIVENTTRLGGTIGTDELCLVYKISCLLEVHFVGSNVSKRFQIVIGKHIGKR